MRYVYLLQSIPHPDRRYVGITEDSLQRLKQHNSSNSRHTKKSQPWNPVVVVRFEADQKAAAFERYLKSGSGHWLVEHHRLTSSPGSVSAPSVATQVLA